MYSKCTIKLVVNKKHIPQQPKAPLIRSASDNYNPKYKGKSGKHGKPEHMGSSLPNNKSKKEMNEQDASHNDSAERKEKADSAFSENPNTVVSASPKDTPKDKGFSDDDKYMEWKGKRVLRDQSSYQADSEEKKPEEKKPGSEDTAKLTRVLAREALDTWVQTKKHQKNTTNSVVGSFSYILGISSLVVAGCAAFFSVKGIALLFAGSFVAVSIMAAGLEVAKLVAASYLYRYWRSTPTLLRCYMFSAIGILIGITSLGIFGFLSDAFETTKTRIDIYETQIENLVTENQTITIQIEEHQSAETIASSRSESAITDYKDIYDSFVSRKGTSKGQYIDRLSALDQVVYELENSPGGLFSSKKTKLKNLNIEQADERQSLAIAIAKIDTDIETEYKSFLTKVESYKEESRKLDSRVDTAPLYDVIAKNNDSILVLKEQIANTDIGSFKFIARAFDTELDSVVKYFILIIVLVFDPLAVTLVLAYNVTLVNKQDSSV